MLNNQEYHLKDSKGEKHKTGRVTFQPFAVSENLR